MLSSALADLHTTMIEIEARRQEGRPTAALVHHQVRLARAVADRCRRFPAATPHARQTTRMAATTVLPTCAGRATSVVRSARLWLNASEPERAADSGSVIVVAGPGLPRADAEAAAVTALYPHPQTLVGDDAVVEHVRSAIDGAALVHIASHGVLRSDNPSFSALRLADGPLTVYELGRLRRAPRHVVLAACEAATPKVVGLDEVLGLAAALLAQGSTSLIAPVVSVVVDDAIVELMVTYHAELQAGLVPAEALARAQERPPRATPRMGRSCRIRLYGGRSSAVTGQRCQDY